MCIQRRNLGGGRWGRVPPPVFHILVKDMSKNRGATHFTLGLRPCIISSFPLQIYLGPLSKLPSCAAICTYTSDIKDKLKELDNSLQGRWIMMLEHPYLLCFGSTVPWWWIVELVGRQDIWSALALVRNRPQFWHLYIQAAWKILPGPFFCIGSHSFLSCLKKDDIVRLYTSI